MLSKKTTCIKTQGQLQQALSIAGKKQSCNFAHFTIGKSGTNKTKLNITIERLYQSKAVTFDANSVTDVEVVSAVSYRQLASMIDVQTFTYDYVLLRFSSALVGEYSSYYNKPLIVVRTKKTDGSGEDWIKVYSVGSMGYTDWDGGSVVSSLPAGDKYRYLPMLSTDGEEKKDSVKFRLISINGKVDDKREAIFNASTNGAFNILKQNYALGIYTKLDLNKFRVKLSKGFTPSFSIGRVESMALYQGYFTSNSPEGYLCREVIKAYETAVNGGTINDLYEVLKSVANKPLEDQQPIDGVLYVNLDSMKDWLEAFLGCTVLSSALLGWMAQLRPATIKALGRILKKKNYVYIVQNQIEECKYRRALLSQAAKIAKDNGDEELYHKLIKLAEAEKIVTTSGCRPEDTDCFTDQNGQKLPFDFNSIIEMHYIASKKSDTHFNMGTQTWNVVFEAARLQGKLEETFKLFCEILNMEADDKLNSLLACKDTVMTPEEFKGGAENRYYNNILRTYAPESGIRLRSILSLNVTDLCNAFSTMFTKCRAELKGFNAYLTFDDYFMYCKPGCRHGGIIPDGRFFCGRKNVGDIIAFKPPTNSSREFFKGKEITLKEVKSLVEADIAAGNITIEGANAYLEELSFTPETAIVLPSLSIYKHLLAGADEDGDTVMIMVFTDDNKEEEMLTKKELLTNEVFICLAKSKALAVVIDR